MALSDYKEKKILDHFNGSSSFTMPTTFYLALYKGDPTDTDSILEVSKVVDDTAYARQAVTWGAATLGIGSASSSNAQTFAAVAGAAAYNVTHAATFDADGTGVVTAGSFVVGRVYTIKTVGTTNFVTIGASASTVGVKFMATGVGTGTGDAYDNGNLLDYGPLDAIINMAPGKTHTFSIGSIVSTIG